MSTKINNDDKNDKINHCITKSVTKLTLLTSLNTCQRHPNIFGNLCVWITGWGRLDSDNSPG